MELSRWQAVETPNQLAYAGSIKQEMPGL